MQKNKTGPLSYTTHKKLLNFGLGNDFLDMTPKSQATKAKINKWDYNRLKSFCTGKEIINKKKMQPKE